MDELTDATFDDAVLRADRPVIVDFFAPWCAPCRGVDGTLAELEQEHEDRLTFVKLNIDLHPEAAARFDVLSIPTVILFEKGVPRETVVGARPRAHYERAWAPWLTTAG